MFGRVQIASFAVKIIVLLWPGFQEPVNALNALKDIPMTIQMDAKLVQTTYLTAFSVARKKFAPYVTMQFSTI